MRVNCIRMGALRLSLALMMALLVIPGYIVAPVLFAKAGSTTLAGMLAGEIFHVTNLALVFLAAAVVVFWLRMRASGQRAGRARWLLLAAVALPVLTNEFVISPIMIDLKLQIGSMDVVDPEHPLRKSFGMWHGISAMIHMVAAISSALLVAIGPMAAHCRSEQHVDS